MSRRQILALPRRALHRAGVSTHRPTPAGSLSGGGPGVGLRSDRPVGTHKQEMYTDQKDGDFGVSRPFSFFSFFFRFCFRECLRRVGVPILYCVLFCSISVRILLKFSSHLCFRHTHEASPYESSMRVNPVFQNDDGVLTQVARIRYPLGSEAGSSQVSEQDTFHSVENIHVSIEVKSKACIMSSCSNPPQPLELCG